MSWTESGYEAVAQFVSQRIGLALDRRHDSIEPGIRRAMTRAHANQFGPYLQLIAADSNALDDLVVELTVGETYFFREPAQFEFLRREVLPALRRRCEMGHIIRSWSAGCASGEEAYSVAILLEQEGLADQAHVLATDISRAGLTRAHQARYSEWSLRGEGRLAVMPYLTRAGAHYRLDDSIRRRVTFEYLNLALDAYPSLATGTWGMDVILCRNVLIYLDRETIRRVARRLAASLADGGWLLTAASDPPLAEDAPLEAVVSERGVFYRKVQPGHAVWYTPFAAPVFDEPVEVIPEAPAESAKPSSPADARGAEDPIAAIRALANSDPVKAIESCAAAIGRDRLSTELHYLHAILLLEQGRDEEAIQAVRRVLYLDRSLALAHFTLGTMLKRRDDIAAARRAYRNARDLCLASPPDQPVALAEGELAGRLAEAAAAQLALLDEGAVP